MVEYEKYFPSSLIPKMKMLIDSEVGVDRVYISLMPDEDDEYNCYGHDFEISFEELKNWLSNMGSKGYVVLSKEEYDQLRADAEAYSEQDNTLHPTDL